MWLLTPARCGTAGDVFRFSGVPPDSMLGKGAFRDDRVVVAVPGLERQMQDYFSTVFALISSAILTE